MKGTRPRIRKSDWWKWNRAAGKRDVVRGDKVRALEGKGFRPVRKSFVVPELPWMRKK